MISKLFVLSCIVCFIAGAKIPNTEVEDGTMFNDQLSPRVVGGTEAEEGQAPYQCSLQKNSRHFCGCVIISSKWIVTAATCLKGNQPQDIDVVVGSNQWNFGGTHYRSQKIISHERFTTDPEYDIGLIQVQEDIKFSERVQSIKYSSKRVPAGVQLQTTGWSYLKDGVIELSTNLLVLNLTTYPDEECMASKRSLCATHGMDRKLCQGDSGGPLVRGDELVGLISRAVTGGCMNGFPDTFTRTSYFYEWIQKETKQN